MGRCVVVVLGMAGCYSPALSGGGGDAPATEDALAIDVVGVDGADASVTLCAPAPNDLPGAAIDVSAGGTWCYGLTAATDQTTPTCATVGQRDLFFEITLDAPEVVLLDTFGSTTRMAIAIATGACSAGMADSVCTAGLCGEGAQAAQTLFAGTSCIVLEEISPGTLDAVAVLNVLRGGADGVALPSTGASVTTDSCAHADEVRSTACPEISAGPDLHVYFTLCPGTSRSVSAQLTCAVGTYELYSRSGVIATADLACAEHGCASAEASVFEYAGPTLHWLVLDGVDPGDCGTNTVTVTY